MLLLIRKRLTGSSIYFGPAYNGNFLHYVRTIFKIFLTASIVSTSGLQNGFIVVVVGGVVVGYVGYYVKYRQESTRIDKN